MGDLLDSYGQFEYSRISGTSCSNLKIWINANPGLKLNPCRVLVCVGLCVCLFQNVKEEKSH